MAKTETINIRIEPTLKQEVEETLKYLGLSMSEAVNLFLRQVVINDGIPFEIKRPKYNRKTRKAMREAEKISKHPEKYKKFNSIEELMEDLNS